MNDFDYTIIKDPEIFQQNRMTAHSDHEWYSNDTKIAEGVSDFKYFLNGIWKFNYATNIELAPKNFYEGTYDVTGWDDIPVPAHIQMQGYGAPQYANTEYPWEGHEEVAPGEIPTRFNPVASYVKFFNVPEFMKKRPVYISFQGAESAIAVWLNGKYVGYSEDSFTPSEFDLTPYIVSGENKLAVQVFRFSAGSWCEDQDFFRFSGIFRDVYLYTVPDVHVRDLRISTLLDDEYKNADLVVDMKGTAKGSYKMELLDGDEDLVISGSGAFDSDTHISIPVEEPELWSAEKPYLYTLLIRVYDEKGKEQEVISERVGFRRFELKNKVMHINGKRIIFKGANRHEFCAQSGRVLPAEYIVKDLETMKRNNINAIRTSHYPNQTVFYRLCDEYGFYVIDETNMETHATWDAILKGYEDLSFALPGDRKEYLGMVLDRAKSMFERDKNHTCILIWSLGNESFGGKDVLEMSKFFHKADATRLVHYEGVWWDKRHPESTDIESTMYRPVDEIREVIKTLDRPYISCEYAHAMGNSIGAISKYTKLAEEEELYQGGFIWDYIDQSITTRDRNGVEYQGYGGDFGDRPCDYDFSGNGLVYGDTREPSPKMQEVKSVYQNIDVTFSEGKFKVKNKNLFTNTDEYDCVVSLEKEGELIEQVFDMLEVEPLSEAEFDIPFEIPDDAEYTVTVSFVLRDSTIWAEEGHEVAWGQQVYGKFRLPEVSHEKLDVSKCWNVIGVRGHSFEVLFSKLIGGIASYKYGGKEMLAAAPKPNFWRAMTQNDIANQLAVRAGQWKIASMYASHKYEHGRKGTEPTVEEKKDSVVVTFTYHLPVRPATDCTVSYEVFGDGRIKCTLDMPASNEVGVLPAFGMIFPLDAEFDHVEWYGLGPDETYADRNHAKLGLYSNMVSENMARYLVPQETGNKENVRYAAVTNAGGRGLEFVCDGDTFGFSALPYSPHELDNALHPNELPSSLKTWVRVGSQMGVGGDDTWGALTHEEFMLKNDKTMKLSFSFKGI
ncbi:MAG: DUF4981 domain-containing protein [Lachnospiraceae bacterium]|nr:DUF4981 domain-containing protein [Lachnospiraceae bacterium]